MECNWGWKRRHHRWGENHWQKKHGWCDEGAKHWNPCHEEKQDWDCHKKSWC